MINDLSVRIFHSAQCSRALIDAWTTSPSSLAENKTKTKEEEGKKRRRSEKEEGREKKKEEENKEEKEEEEKISRFDLLPPRDWPSWSASPFDLSSPSSPVSVLHFLSNKRKEKKKNKEKKTL